LGITSGGSSTIQAPILNAKVGTANVEATSSFKVKANGTAALESGGEFTVRGQTVGIQSNVRMNLKALDSLTLEGQSIDLEASGEIRLRGSSIRQN
jgi:hypothetical protein